MFAGSVVRQDYDWCRFLAAPEGRPPEVGQVCNFVATADGIGTVFPKAFQRLGILELGSAGHDGFNAPATLPLANRRFVAGGHGAALTEELWDNIARFVVAGELAETPAPVAASRQSRWSPYSAGSSPCRSQR